MEGSTLHSPTCPSGVRADCTDSLGLRADSAQTVWTPYDFGSPHKNYTMRELNQAPGTNSHLQGGVLYHCAIVACYTLPTCAIYVTCDLIGMCVYIYSIWDMIYVLDQFFNVNLMVASVLQLD